MKFERLRVLGFKSFVEPMEFIIDDGLTGVVGPNGCGKSNLVEALRWVMGENSYKNMRASGMDDVIFSGSLNRPARNTAEVTLFLENSDRTAPSGYNDSDTLEVTRRIEREAGSVYKINGKDVRAKDVQLLFADASTGARSPAMVRQGQIGELISAKPTSRRKILEEAAGISGLHSRRKEAELRLRAAETNLGRLEDVVLQIEGQLDGLKRQARQATRYRNLSSEIRKAEATILYLRWHEATAALEAARKQYAEAEIGMRDVAGLQASTAKEQALAAHEIPALREASAAAAAALQHLIIAKNDLESEDRRVKEKLTDLQARLVQMEQDIEREAQLTEENVTQLEELEAEKQELLEAAETLEERAEQAQEHVLIAEDNLDAGEMTHARITQDHASLLAKHTQLESQISAIRQKTARYKEEAERFKEQLAVIEADIKAASGPDDKREELELALEELAEAEEASVQAEEALASAREDENTCRNPLSEANSALSRFETEAKTLQAVLSAGQSGDWTPAVDRISVNPGLETALGAALGEGLDAAMEESAPVRWSLNSAQQGDPQLPNGAEPLSKFVKAPDELTRRLAQIGLVEAQNGPALMIELAVGQRLVSKQGDLWRWDGLIIAADAPTPAAQRLAQRNRLSELEDLVAQTAELVEDKREALENATEQRRQAELFEQDTRHKLRLEQSRIVALREELAAAERAVTELSVRKTTLKEQSRRANEDYTDTAASLEEAQNTLADLSDIAGVTGELEQAAKEVSSMRSKLAEANGAVEAVKREGELRLQRLETIERDRQNWVQRTQNADKQISVLRQRRDEAVQERLILLESPEEIEHKRQDLLNALTKAEEARKASDDKLAEGEKRQLIADQKAREALEGFAGARERKVRAEERLEAAKERRVEIERRVEELLEARVSRLHEMAGLSPDAPLPDAQGAERKLDRLKAERERLGGVNLRADEEMQEITEQRDTLITERDDLIEAIRKLRTGIMGLNRDARERLLTSFEHVNEHFKRLFTHLFGGGTAELKLVDAEDPLDAGLEIFARPPGKKPQTMTLLSGGEQALTAMALIFAVFLTNPAPICVLDEVDAPLDDANVERYCALLENMAANTQTRFTVITHNPITMARMSRLFGVTMAERGVSQLVSVDLETAERFTETA
ncbi:Chromosome partition protein Smc [Pseudovibrio axinellae]|uniref:Chromosome partition protein Smc n=1 Tax=Pseudovibrio axinellae TaxID=989403 RepID=A0A165YFB7_9HYPH|nr:chromosome segregation protein SMC [Pseudovibrio axinellae]KZL18794.1 Chromosome partition protein Smc [Pseudovibrio axinellae]SEP92588.1 condensin subunit Smc [Pseudovibrio axinellae]